LDTMTMSEPLTILLAWPEIARNLGALITAVATPAIGLQFLVSYLRRAADAS